MSKVKGCGCKHPMQDEMYGDGKRLMNERASGGLRCTVCGKDVADNATPAKKK